MKSNFLEKIIPFESEEKRLLLNKISEKLDESIEACINLRQRQKNELYDKPKKFKNFNKYKDLILTELNEFDNDTLNNRNNNNPSFPRHSQVFHNYLGFSRFERILNMMEETVRLNTIVTNEILDNNNV
jgi:hypothetical protein